MAEADVREDLLAIIRARTPLFYLGCIEIQRAMEELRASAREAGAEVWVYSAATQTLAVGKEQKATDPLDVLNCILKRIKEGRVGRANHILWVLVFYHLFLRHPDGQILSGLREIVESSRFTDTVVILGAPEVDLPPELSDIQVVRLPEPGPDQIEAWLDHDLPEEAKGEAVRSCLGLSAREIEDVLALSLARHGRIDARHVRRLRDGRLAARGQGILTVERPVEGLKTVGGLRALQRWLRVRLHAFLNPQLTQRTGLSMPKGVLLTGVPGCGKSLMCRAIAGEWDLPLLRLDPARIYSSALGESEGRLRLALSVAQRAAPCILWVDEVEKGFAPGDPRTDGGVSGRIMGSFLQFLEMRPAPIFVVATANDPHALPPEFLRRGRWDEVFFIDLPDPEERQAVIEIQLDKMGLDLDVPEEFASLTEGFSGAEIESAMQEAAYECLYRDIPVSSIPILNVLKRTRPISLLQPEKIHELRRWGLRQARLANTGESPMCVPRRAVSEKRA